MPTTAPQATSAGHQPAGRAPTIIDARDPVSAAPNVARYAAGTLLAGIALAIVGAAIAMIDGEFVLFSAMEATTPAEVGEHLTAVAGAQGRLLTGLVMHIIGIPLFALGYTLASQRGGNQVWGTIARWATAAGTGALIVFFSLMIGIVVGLAPAHVAGEDVFALTRTIGLGADTADQFTTVLILCVGGLAAVMAGRGTWAPRWLVRYSVVMASLGVASLIPLAWGNYGLSSVPFPLMIVHPLLTGIALLRVKP